jgi:hypothetical protein
MAVLKALFLAVIVASLALPPVAAAKMGAAGSDAPAAAPHSKCCPPGQDCDKPAKGDCGQDSVCALKCASVSPALATPASITPKLSSFARVSLLAGSIAARTINPPLPPPRI